MDALLARLRLLLSALGSLAVFLLVSLLRPTWRVRVVGRHPDDGANLFVYWHGEQLALTRVLRRGLTVLVSRSRDGQWATRVARWLGYDVVRGSSSAGAVAGALGLVRRLRARRPVGLAVDGPRGPRGRTGQAPLRLARQGGAALVPVSASARRGLRLATWDRFLVPAPFTTIVVVFGDPLGAGQQVQGELDRAAAQACALAGS